MLLFLKIMATEFIAEMGDKTQLMLLALTSKYKLRDIVLGTAAAILVLNGIAVLAGGLFSALVPTWLIKLIAAIAFLYFALTSLGEDDDEEEEGEGKGGKGLAIVQVFCTFFVAEFGDKTQLTAITFGANEGLSKAIVVWLACSIGLFAADILGMAAGYFLQGKFSAGAIKKLAFVVFAVFGMLTMREALGLIPVLTGSMPMIILALVFAAFVVGAVVRLRK